MVNKIQQRKNKYYRNKRNVFIKTLINDYEKNKNKKGFSPSILANLKSKRDSRWHLKYIKYIQHVFRSKKKKHVQNENDTLLKTKFNRYIIFYPLYKKRKQNYFVFSNKLKKLKKKIIKSDINRFLWKSLTTNGLQDFIRFNDNIDIDKKYNKFPLYVLNYYNINDYKKKKKKYFIKYLIIIFFQLF